MSEVSRGWKLVALAHVCDVNPRDPGPGNPSTAVSFVPMPAVSDTEGVILQHDTKPFGDVAKGYTRFREQDVIFAKITPCMENGKIAVAAGLHGGFACGSTEFHVLRSSSAILPAYVWRFVRQESFRKDAERHMTGAVGQRRVPAQYIRDAVIPLPPVPEQRRIVDRLDRIFKRSKSARDELDHIPKLLERYKRAVIRAASTGRLTADWRSHSKQKESATDFLLRISRDRQSLYEQQSVKARQDGAPKPRRPTTTLLPGADTSAYSHIPDGWSVARVRDIADCLDYLRVPINKEARLSRSGEVPYYGANGQVGWINDYLFNEDLVLVVEDETFIGREKPFSYIIRGKSWVNNHAHVLRTLGEMPTEFLNIILSYYDFTPITSGSTGRRKLTQEALLNAPVWIPSHSEQVEIVRRVDRALCSIETIAAEGRRAAALVARLEQATLSKAFRGELVPKPHTSAQK